MAVETRLSLFWLLYMGAMGVIFPFLTLYLAENAGLSGSEVGALAAVSPLVGLVAPNFWGGLADRSGSRVRLLALLVVASALANGLLAVLSGFAALLAGLALAASVSTAVLPIGVAVSLAALGIDGRYRFGLVRVWGTVGYLATVIAFPWVLHGFQRLRGLQPFPGGPSEPGLELMFVVASALVLVSAPVVLAIPQSESLRLRPSPAEWRQLRSHAPFLRMLLYQFLAFVFLQGPMNLFPVLVRARGGDLDSVSHLWILMLLPEIPLVALSGVGLRRFGARSLLACGVLAGGFRWAVCGLSDDLRLLYVSQPLHGVLVAGLLIGAPLYVESAVPESLRSTAQARLAMAGAGVGGIVSSLVSGWLLESFGAPLPYALGGFGALVLGALTAVILPAPSRPPDGSPSLPVHAG